MNNLHPGSESPSKQIAVYAEVAKRQYEHTSFNGGVLSLAQELGEDVILLADHSHITCLAHELHCQFVEIPVPPLGGRLQSIWKYLVEFRVVLDCIRYARNQRTQVTFLSVSPSTLFFLGILARLGIGVAVFVHNELELLTPHHTQSRYRIRRQLMLRALTLLANGRSRVICLTRAGTDLLTRRFPGLDISYSHHPMNPSAQRFIQSPKAKRPTGHQVFALVGTLREAVINAHIRALCDDLEGTEIGSHKPKIHIIGGRGLESASRVRLEMCAAIEPHFVEAPTPNAYLNAIATCDVVLFLSSPSLYAVSASGVLIDAVSLGVEVYALRCGYAEELTQSHNVHIFDSISQVAEAVRGKIRNNISDDHLAPL